MHVAFVSTIVSAVVLALLVVLFRAEVKRDARFFERVRSVFDRWVERAAFSLARFFAPLRREVIVFHVGRGMHWLLEQVQRNLARLQKRVSRVMHSHGAKVREGGGSRGGNLSEIAAHKAEVSLSEEERREHKERAVGTSLR